MKPPRAPPRTDRLTIAHRLVARRRLADDCDLDRLLAMSRAPGGGLDLPALLTNVAALFPQSTSRQVDIGLAMAHRWLADRPGRGAAIVSLADRQLDLFAGE